MNQKNKNKDCNHLSMIVIALITLLLNGCGISDGFGLFAEEPEPIPVYTIDINISASNKLNPDLEGRPSPVVARIYQLKNIDTFENSDFFAIYENDKVLLGKDITFRKELEIKPNDEFINSNKLKEGTQYLAIFAAFRDLNKAVWQLVVKVKPEQTTSLTIKFDQFTLSIKAGEGDNEKDQAKDGEEKEGEAKEPKAPEAETKAKGEAKGSGAVKEENASWFDSLDTSSWGDTFLEYIGFIPNPVTVHESIK